MRREFVFSNLSARIVQHEVDHLTGTFFVDRISNKKRKEVMDRFFTWKSMRKAQSIEQKGKSNGNVDAGFIAAHGGRARLS